MATGKATGMAAGTARPCAEPAAAEHAILAPVIPRLARTTRAWCARWLIGSLLFLQLASAAYACTMGSAQAASMEGMPCAQAMADGLAAALDPEQPGLCLEHCKGGSQALDPGTPGNLPAPALAALYVVPAAPQDLAAARLWRQARQRSHANAPPPPHSILHCCYRI